MTVFPAVDMASSMFSTTACYVFHASRFAPTSRPTPRVSRCSLTPKAFRMVTAADFTEPGPGFASIRLATCDQVKAQSCPTGADQQVTIAPIAHNPSRALASHLRPGSIVGGGAYRGGPSLRCLENVGRRPAPAYQTSLGPRRRSLSRRAS